MSIYSDELDRIKTINKEKKKDKIKKIVIYNIQKYVPLTLSLTILSGASLFVLKNGIYDYYNKKTVELLDGSKTVIEQKEEFSKNSKELIHYNKWYKENDEYKRKLDICKISQKEYEQFKYDFKNNNITDELMPEISETKYEIATKIDKNEEYYCFAEYDKDYDKSYFKSMKWHEVVLLLFLLSVDFNISYMCKIALYDEAKEKLKKFKDEYLEIDTSFLEKKIEKTK